MIIIHIGTHKTATTYLQKQYFNSLEGINYIDLKTGLDNWLVDNYGEEDTLISSEIFSGLPWEPNTNGGIRKLSWLESFNISIAKLKTIFGDPIVIVMFRRHGDLLVSMYKQYLQIGGTLSLNEFYGKGDFLTPEELLLKPRIELLEKSFSKVFFLNYEVMRSNGSQYLDKFFHDLLNIQSFNENLQSRTGSNVSVSGRKLEMLRRVNILYKVFPKCIAKFLALIGLSPREIFQKKLKVLKGKDSKEINNLKDQINRQLKDDWKYFESKQWKG
jgi:hypothetical protein